MVGKCALHKPWKTRSVQLKPNQFTPVIHTALPLASTILFFSTCSQSEPVATLEVTELELLFTDELELLFTEELVTTEELLLLLTDELITTELDALDFTELAELGTLDLIELDELGALDLIELAELTTTELDELDLIELDEVLTTDDVAPSQIPPVIAGFSAIAPPFVP